MPAGSLMYLHTVICYISATMTYTLRRSQPHASPVPPPREIVFSLKICSHRFVHGHKQPRYFRRHWSRLHWLKWLQSARCKWVLGWSATRAAAPPRDDFSQSPPTLASSLPPSSAIHCRSMSGRASTHITVSGTKNTMVIIPGKCTPETTPAPHFINVNTSPDIGSTSPSCTSPVSTISAGSTATSTWRPKYGLAGPSERFHLSTPRARHPFRALIYCICQ